MKNSISVTALSATFLVAAATVLTYLKPEEPNFIGKAFFFSGVYSSI